MNRIPNNDPAAIGRVPAELRGLLDGCSQCADADVYVPQAPITPEDDDRVVCSYRCDAGHTWQRGYSMSRPEERPMPEMTDDRIREIVEEIVLDHARDIEFLSVCERLAEEAVDDPNDDLARRIHDLAMSATVTVQISDPKE